jgi:hypothetical protein
MDAPTLEQSAQRITLRHRIVAAGGSETAKAAGLAVATMVQQVLAVVFTVVFTRILGTGGYGSLAALMNLTVILLVPGSALQVAAARQGTLGRLGRGGELAATLDRWTRHLLAGLFVVAVVSVLARHQLAAIVNVHEEWAAAAVPVAAAFWLLLSVQRGLLQAAQAYRPVASSSRSCSSRRRCTSRAPTSARSPPGSAPPPPCGSCCGAAWARPRAGRRSPR